MKAILQKLANLLPCPCKMRLVINQAARPTEPNAMWFGRLDFAGEKKTVLFSDAAVDEAVKLAANNTEDVPR